MENWKRRSDEILEDCGINLIDEKYATNYGIHWQIDGRRLVQINQPLYRVVEKKAHSQTAGTIEL